MMGHVRSDDVADGAECVELLFQSVIERNGRVQKELAGPESDDDHSQAALHAQRRKRSVAYPEPFGNVAQFGHLGPRSSIPTCGAVDCSTRRSAADILGLEC